MDALRLLVELAGEAALLLFGLGLVQRGVERALGPSMRQGLNRALGSRWRAFAAGLAATAALQSSTAAGLMIARLQGTGLLALTAALAAMLGANVGTALIVQALSFDLRAVFPALILIGWIAFRRARRARTRDLGRAAIGLGLMLAALHLMLSTMAPVEDSAALRSVLPLLNDSPLPALVLAAALAWATHSSLAAVLLIGSLAAAGLLGPSAAIAMVAGANLGGAVPPLLAARHDRRGTSAPAAMRLPLGNLFNRAAGAVLVLALLGPLTQAMAALDPNPARLVANAHLGFNLALALLFLPLLDPLAAGLRRLLPDLAPEADPGAPRYLDPAALATPSVALANAAREVLRLADQVEAMLRAAADALARADRDAARNVGALDDTVDRLHGAVHAYLAGLPPRESLGLGEARRLAEIRHFAIAMEHAGDMVDRGLVRHAARRARRGIALSDAEAARLRGLHERLVGQLRLAVAVFMMEDSEAARRLVQEKEAWREAEREAADHLAETGADPSPAAGLALDVTRDLKRIAAHVAAIAYPLLERQGALRTSRLRPAA